MARFYLALGQGHWAAGTAWGLSAEGSWRTGTAAAALAGLAAARRRAGVLPEAAGSMGTASHTSLLSDTALVLPRAWHWTYLCKQCPEWLWVPRRQDSIEAMQQVYMLIMLRISADNDICKAHIQAFPQILKQEVMPVWLLSVK